MLPSMRPLKARMLSERGSTSKTSDRNNHLFYSPRSLLALKNQNRAKVYLREKPFNVENLLPFQCSHIIQTDLPVLEKAAV